MSDSVTLYEVGPRDGLQNEKIFVPTDDKIGLINRLSECGYTKIEAASFVSPKWVPQMADGADVMAGITRKPGITYAALTPNMFGYERSQEANVAEVALFGAASESFSQKNINCSMAESLERFRPVAERAKADGVPLRGYVSVVVNCPYEGDVEPAAVAKMVKAMLDLGCYQISLGDTTGFAKPEQILSMLDAVLAEVPADRLAGHYHDTGGLALSNIEVSIERGLRTFDSAVGGLGGCPYAPSAKGNVDTLLVYDRLTELGVPTGLDREKLVGAGGFLQEVIARITHG